MNTKKKFRLGWCSRILFLAALLCLCLQLAIVATGQHSRPITTSVHRPSNYTATSTRRIVYVHIGKTGGEFIKSQLAIICKTRKNPKVKQTCLDSFATPQEAPTALSRQTGGYLHVHTLFPRNAIAWASHYLFSIRHPLHRLVSWYVYNHPQSCDPRESNSPSCKSSDWKTQFFECFPTLEALGRGHVSKKAGNCAQVLWNGWYGRLSNVKEPNHLYWNYQFYWNQTMARWPKPVLVVRQEHLTKDLNHLELYLGTKSPSPWRPSDSQHVVTGRVPSALTGHASRSLCCLLQAELEIYQQLVQLAENLSLNDKVDTIHQAYQLCGVQNHDWKELSCK